MPDSAYFTLADHVGLDPDVNPEPLVEIGLTIVVPTMVGIGIGEVEQRVTLKPIPGTRVVKIDDPIVANALRSRSELVETDAPTQKDLKKSREAVTDAREHAGTHVETEES